ncbi:inositol monophosphatase family protein [Fundidesulfovibrio butyratiphilus]
MDASTLSPLLPKALQAVRQAGEIIKDHWDRPRDIRRKGRIDLVTQTDLAVERALIDSLAPLVPEATFLAEESATKLEPGRLTWIIDPLDGTTNFAHHVPFVASSVALWCEGRTVLGIVNAPILGETFWAVEGAGAFMNHQPMRVSEVDNLEDSLVATGFPYSVREDIRPIMEDFESVVMSTQGVRRPGAAAVDLAYVASGRFDAFYEMRLKPWDTAAGWLLVREAGGRVSSFDPNVPYALGSPTILASNGLLHEAVGGLLRR